MTDYIKREDALKIINYMTENYDDYCRCTNMINNLPSADVVERSSYESMEHTVAKLNEALSNSVEVVRCKDCKHRPIDTQEEGNGFDYEFPEEYGCPGYCDDGYYSQRFKDDFYCAWGERADT